MAGRNVSNTMNKYTIIIWSYLLCTPVTLQFSLYQAFTYIVVSIPQELGRQPAPVLFTLLFTFRFPVMSASKDEGSFFFE